MLVGEHLDPSNGDPAEPLLLSAAAPDRPPAHASTASWWAGAAAEAGRLTSLSYPLIIEELLTYSSTMVAVGAAGRLGAHALAVFVLARSVTNITGLATINGMSSAIETLCSQAHGSGAAGLLGVVLQRALLIQLLGFAPLLLLWWWTEPLLLLLGQAPDLASAAARYVLVYSPTVLLHGQLLCIYRYLVAQGAVAHVLAAGAAFAAVTLPLNWLLVFRLRLGLDGSALAAVASEVFYLAAMIAAAAVHHRQQPPHRQPWQGLSWAALSGWGHHLQLAAASATMLCLDWWQYDVNTLLAGTLPDPGLAVAASGILYNVNALAFMMPFGMAFAVAFRVGSLLGGCKAWEAKLTAEVGTALGLGCMAALAAPVLVAGQAVARLFTSDAAVARLCGALVPQLVVIMLTNGSTAVLSAVLRGCGRQKLGAVCNAAVNWAVGLPLQLLAVFVMGWGIAGLWWGLAASSVLQTLVLALLASRVRWQQETVRAARLVRRISSSHETCSPPAAP